MRIDRYIRAIVWVSAVAFAGNGVADARIGFLWRRSKSKMVLPRPQAPEIVIQEAKDIFPMVLPDEAPLVKRTLSPQEPSVSEGWNTMPAQHRSEERACYDEDFFEPVEVADVFTSHHAETAADISETVAVAEPEPDAMSAAVEAMVDFKNDPMLIFGKSQVSPDVMARFAASQNKNFDPRIARAFHEVGRRYGIRGDIAFCQAIVETGWFMFTGGTAVRPSQHNYCGLGVLKKGMRGHSFKSVEEGVTAQIQHLYAYASKNRLPKGEKLIDPRFDLVARGCATTWHDLSNRWAANPDYGASIMDLYRKLLQFK